MRTETELKQLREINKLPHKIVGGDDILGDFEYVIFPKSGDGKLENIRVKFADYILNPPPQFDLHERWNNGIAPPEKVMYGRIVKETNGMYHFVLKTEFQDNVWDGWCPKSSCEVEML